MTIRHVLMAVMTSAICLTAGAKPLIVLQPGDEPFVAQDAVVYCGDPQGSVVQKFYQCSISRCNSAFPDKEFFCNSENKWSTQLTGKLTKKFKAARETAVAWANGAIYRNMLCDLVTLDEVGKEMKRVSIPNVDAELPDLK